MRSQHRAIGVLLCVATVVAAGCGDEDETSAPATAPATTAPAATAPAATSPPPTTVAPTTIPPTTTEPAPTTTIAPLPDAVELLTSLNLTGDVYGLDYTIPDPPAADDAPSPGLAAALASRPECVGIETELPLPYSQVLSAAQVVFTHPVNGANWSHLAVMESEEAARAYIAELNEVEGLAACLEAATVASFTGIPEGITMEARDAKLGDRLPGYGETQAYLTADLVVFQGGVELLTIVGGSRYGHVGPVLLLVGGVEPNSTNFAGKFHSLVTQRLA